MSEFNKWMIDAEPNAATDRGRMFAFLSSSSLTGPGHSAGTFIAS